MVVPRSGLATKGIVPFDLIKSFSFSDWIKDFPEENILNAKVTSVADFFYRWDEGLYHDLYFDYIL